MNVPIAMVVGVAALAGALQAAETPGVVNPHVKTDKARSLRHGRLLSYVVVGRHARANSRG